MEVRRGKKLVYVVPVVSLSDLTRENCERVVSRLCHLPTDVKDDGVYVTLPPPVKNTSFKMPRMHPVSSQDTLPTTFTSRRTAAHTLHLYDLFSTVYVHPGNSSTAFLILPSLLRIFSSLKEETSLTWGLRCTQSFLSSIPVYSQKVRVAFVSSMHLRGQEMLMSFSLQLVLLVYRHAFRVCLSPSSKRA